MSAWNRGGGLKKGGKATHHNVVFDRDMTYILIKM